MIFNHQEIIENSQDYNANKIFLLTNQNKKFYDHSIIKNTITPKELIKKLELNNINIIGITGTNGKTSTANIISSILKNLEENVATQGTQGFFINEKIIEPKTLTTPSILNTIKHLQLAKEKACKYFVMEVSSHALEQKRIEGLNFALKILTNITQDHLDYHKTFENYKNIKESFFQDDSIKLINKDIIPIKFNKKNCYTYSLEHPASFKINAYSLNNGIEALIQNIKQLQPFSSPLVGLFNVYNLLASVSAVSITTSYTLEQICKTVSKFKGVSGRMEIVHTNPTIIVDFAHTPDGIENVLDSLKNPNLTVIFGAGGDRDKSKRKIMGNIVQKYAKNIIITNDNPRTEDPMRIIDDIIEGLDDNSDALVIPDRIQAINHTLKQAKKEDIIFILGKGDEKYIEINHNKIPHNDKKCVQTFYKENQ